MRCRTWPIESRVWDGLRQRFSFRQHRPPCHIAQARSRRIRREISICHHAQRDQEDLCRRNTNHDREGDGRRSVLFGTCCLCQATRSEAIRRRTSPPWRGACRLCPTVSAQGRLRRRPTCDSPGFSPSPNPAPRQPATNARHPRTGGFCIHETVWPHRRRVPDRCRSTRAQACCHAAILCCGCD